MKLNFIAGLACGIVMTASAGAVFFSFHNSTYRVKNVGLEKPTAIKGSEQLSSNSPMQSDDHPSALTRSSETNLGLPHSLEKHKAAVKETSYPAGCDANCVDAVISKFLDMEDFSANDWDIIKDSGDDIATAISTNPEAIQALRNKVSYSSEESEIDGLLTIVSMLSDEHALGIIKDVADYSNTHKTLALQTLAGLSLHSKEAAREIENLVIGERDPEVLSAALNALETIDNYDFSPATWQSLSEQFSYVQDEQLQSSILITLAKHGKGDPLALTNNVEVGLDSESSDLQSASIEALGYLISRSENEESLSPIVKSDGFESRLTAIANNSDAEPAARIAALTLLEEAF